jgi:hypothetical protein
MRRTLLAATVAAALPLFSVVAQAQTAPAPAAPAAAPAPRPVPNFIRGKVTSLEGNVLTVATREGGVAVVKLTPDWTVTEVKPVSPDAIQKGSFIGTTEVDKPDGTGMSLEVHVFPPGVKMGEGHYPWDLKPGSNMTNGTIDNVVSGVSGRTVDVSFPGGVRHVEIPANIPIVQFGLGDKALLKPGAGVFIGAVKQADGTYISNRVTTGANGVNPPM